MPDRLPPLRSNRRALLRDDERSIAVNEATLSADYRLCTCCAPPTALATSLCVPIEIKHQSTEGSQ